MGGVMKTSVAVAALVVAGLGARATGSVTSWGGWRSEWTEERGEELRGRVDEPRDLAGMLEPIRAKHELPALGAAVVTSKGVWAIGVAGTRIAGGAEPVTASDQWHLGSCTKAMTATLCAILVEQGKTSWKTTLAEAFPDLARRMHPDFKGVTLEQLCSNRGGVPGDLSADGLWGKLWNHRGTPTEARRVLLEGVVTRAPAYKLGEKWEYANGGFAIAGHVCETVTGKAYEELLRELIFEPLGMKSAGFGAPGKAGAKPVDEPRGHTKEGKPAEPTEDGRGADNPPAITPAGRVHCSLEDWGKFVAFHLRGARGEAQKIGAVELPAGVFAKLHTPLDGLSDYAMGWVRAKRPWGGKSGVVYNHNGSNTMWYCVTWFSPEQDLAVLVCTNRADPGGAKGTDEVAGALIRARLKAVTEGEAGKP